MRGGAAPGRAVPVLAGLVFAACLWLLARGYAIDDTYIHLQFARNLASGNGFRFDTGAPPVYACSSPLWVLLLAPSFLAGVGGPETARLLSSLAAGACVWASWLIARRTPLKPLLRASIPVLVALDPWMVRWGASGMESALAALLVLFWLLSLSGDRPSPAAAGLLAGLAFLARPELVFLGPMTLLFAPRGLRTALLALAPWALVVGGWILAACGIFGRPFPTAAAAKARSTPLAGYLAGELSGLAGAVALSHGPLLLALAAGATKTDWRSRTSRRVFATALVPLVLLVLLLAGGAPLVTRYLVPVLPLVTITAVGVVARGMVLPKRLLAPFLVLAAGWQLAAGGIVVWPHMVRMAANMRVYHQVAQDLARLTPEGSVIAVQEIGVFGWAGERELLDLGGLVTEGVDPESFPGLGIDAERSLEFLRERGATHYLDPHGAVEPLLGARDRLGTGFEALGTWVFPGGTSLSGAGTYERVLYRLDFTEAD